MKSLAPALVLLTLSAIAYVNADHDTFLFDSAYERIDQPSVRNIGEALFQVLNRPWHPGTQVTNLTFAVNFAVNDTLGRDGFDPTGYLVVNVLIHGMNAFLVFLLIRALTSQCGDGKRAGTWVALAPVILFAVHPMQASSVAYIIQRRGMLAAGFYLLGVLAYLRARAMPARTVRAYLRAILAVGLCYWLSIRSKPLGLTLPLAILSIELCLRLPDRRRLKQSALWISGGMVLSVLALMLYLWQRGLFEPTTLRILPWGPHALWGPWTHFLTESRVFVHYWKLLLLPLPRWSCIDHDVLLSTTPWEHYAYCAVLFHGLLIGAALLIARRGFSLAAIGILWFYVALVPYVLLPQTELMVEYKTYLPSVAGALLLAEVFGRLRFRVPAALEWLLLVALAALLLATTIGRNTIYRNPINLWTDAVRKSPNKARPAFNLGTLLGQAGRHTEAVRHLERAAELWPDRLDAHFHLGLSYAALKQYDRALREYELATKLPSVQRRGTVVESQAPHERLAQALLQLGDHFTRGGGYEQAAKCYELAGNVSASLATAFFNHTEVLFSLGRDKEAIGVLHAGISANPEDDEMSLRLAWILSTHPDKSLRDGQAATELMTRFIDPRGPPNLREADVYAACLAETGRFQDALRVLRTAIQSDGNASDAALNAAMQERLQAYAVGRPWSEPP